MKSGGPWNLRGLLPEVCEAARAAARQSGLSVGEWLNGVIEVLMRRIRSLRSQLDSIASRAMARAGAYAPTTGGTVTPTETTAK